MGQLQEMVCNNLITFEVELYLTSWKKIRKEKKKKKKKRRKPKENLENNNN